MQQPIRKHVSITISLATGYHRQGQPEKEVQVKAKHSDKGKIKTKKSSEGTEGKTRCFCLDLS